MDKNAWDVYNDAGKIGTGRTGPCHIMEHKETGHRYCGKIVYKHNVSKKKKNRKGRARAAKMREKLLVDLRREIALLKTLDSPYVAKIIESYEDAKRLFLVEELCTGGSLLSRIPEGKGFSESKAAQVFYEMVSAVSHCHEHNIAHRDLKLEHFMFQSPDEDSSIVLIDFGLSHRFGARFRRMNTFVSTVFYTAPEILAKLMPKLREHLRSSGFNDEGYSEKVDHWSLGVLLYMLLSGHAPFQAAEGEKHDMATEDSSIEGKIEAFCLGKAVLPFEQDFRAEVSKDAKDMVLGLLQGDPRKRFSLRQVLESQWLNSRHTIEKPALSKSTAVHLKNFTELSKLEVACLEALSLTLSSKQLRRLRIEFENVDTDHNGLLSVEELKLAISNSNLAENGNLNMDSLFQNMDVEHSGGIRFRKFVAAAMKSSEYFTEAHLKEAFAKFDRNGEGGVQLTQLHAILQHLFEEEEVELAMAELRKNSCDTLDYETFIEIIKRVRAKDLVISLISPKLHPGHPTSLDITSISLTGHGSNSSAPGADDSSDGQTSSSVQKPLTIEAFALKEPSPRPQRSSSVDSSHTPIQKVSATAAQIGGDASADREAH